MAIFTETRLIIPQSDVDPANPEIGAKTKRLAELARLGFNVPKFAAVPAIAMSLKHDKLAAMAKAICETLPCAAYAIRSSALAEDNEKSSMAGHFRTCLNVTPDRVQHALETVIADAVSKLSGDLYSFSVLAQEYIHPDFAGVLFTRSPARSREMRIEWTEGAGDKLVSGEVAPKSAAFRWTDWSEEQPAGPPDGTRFTPLVAECRKIEDHYQLPQDIEWCCRSGTYYILQTRPITTLSKEEYLGFVCLDATLPKTGDYSFQKNGVSETVPRPTPLTFSLLQRMYGPEGPIAQAYDVCGVRYFPQDQFKLFGAELFVDTALELQSIFPSMKLLPDGKRSWSLRGAWSTTGNIAALQSLDLKRYPELIARIQARFRGNPRTDSLGDALEAFFGAYALVFEINLRAQAAQAALQREQARTGANAGFTAAPGVNVLGRKVRRAIHLHPPDAELIGNSLEFADTSRFTPAEFSDGADAPWETNAGSAAQYCAIYAQLREYGRWITVKYRTELFKSICRSAERSGVTPELVCFATLDDLFAIVLDADEIAARRERYLEACKLRFPPVISSECGPKLDSRAPEGVSAGVAEGILVRAEELAVLIRESSGAKDDLILYTDILTPELAAHFDSIKGIVSETGGMLSHSAILARERGIPVVTNVKIARSGLAHDSFLGAKVRIDGNTGEVTRADTALLE